MLALGTPHGAREGESAELPVFTSVALTKRWEETSLGNSLVVSVTCAFGLRGIIVWQI